MANPAGLLRHAAAAPANNRRRLRVRLRPRPQLLANSALLLLGTAGSVVIYHGAANPSAGTDEQAYVLLAFLLSLLGIWLALFAVVADRFPGTAARACEVVARALRGYFLGPGGATTTN